MFISIERAVETLRGCDNALILTHQSPDGDAVGCAAALCEALRTLGKSAYVYDNPEAEEALRDYSAAYHADDGFSPDFVIAVDVADRSILAKGAEEMAVDLCIDHHASNRDYAGETYLDKDAAACAEPVYELICALGVGLTKSMAACLYLAETTDTGGFRYPSVTPRSMRLGAELIETGIDFYRINNEFLEQRSLKQLQLESYALSCCEFMQGGGALTALSAEGYARLGVEDSDTSNISSYLRSIVGVRLAAFMRERDAGKWRVSVRSQPPYSAARVCGALSGGGHECAAGATVEGDYASAYAAVKSAVEAELARCEEQKCKAL